MSYGHLILSYGPHRETQKRFSFCIQMVIECRLSHNILKKKKQQQNKPIWQTGGKKILSISLQMECYLASQDHCDHIICGWAFNEVKYNWEKLHQKKMKVSSLFFSYVQWGLIFLLLLVHRQNNVRYSDGIEIENPLDFHFIWQNKIVRRCVVVSRSGCAFY